MAGFFWFIQFQIDKNPEPFSWMSIGLNLLLFMLFPLQHSVLPRPRVKAWIHKHFSVALERSLYVGTSGIVMWIVLLGWKPVGPMLFVIHNSLPFEIVFFISIFLIILSTVALDHSATFGLKQGYLAWKMKELKPSRIQKSGIYSIIRHPLTSLLIVCLWSHATMTTGRLLLNSLFTIYAIAGTVFEERDLVQKFGREYEDYRDEVPSFIPFLK